MGLLLHALAFNFTFLWHLPLLYFYFTSTTLLRPRKYLLGPYFVVRLSQLHLVRQSRRIFDGLRQEAADGVGIDLLPVLAAAARFRLLPAGRRRCRSRRPAPRRLLVVEVVVVGVVLVAYRLGRRGFEAFVLRSESVDEL